MKSGFHVLFRMFTRLVRVNKFAFILFALLASSSAWAGTTYKITQEEGSACIYGNYMTSCEIPTEAEEGEVVTLSVVTAERYVLDTVRVYDETARKYLTVTDGKWFDNTASFVMPASDVRVEVRTKSPGSDLYVNMPATGTKKITLPSRMRSFWVYDDGGKNQNYSNNASGTLQLVAPEGHSFGINVKYLNTESGKDKLTVYDGINSTNKLYDGISGDRVETKPFSTGNSIKIFFESNGSTNKSGFEIQIDVEDRGLAGSGTEADPFVIGSENDWDWFRTNVRAGNSYAGQFIRLDADIAVSGMVGSADKGMAFSGTFDGKGKDGSMHTIMANISDTHSGTALFQYISGATIKNLAVAGSIVGGVHAAGLVGISSGTGNRIENCVVSATVEGGSHIGGVLGNGDKSDISIDNCVFKGKLVGGTTAMGVFFGWGDNGGTKVVKNSLYIPDSKQTFSNLDLVKMDAGSVTVTDCYKMFVSLNTFAALEAYSHISGTMVFPNADNNVWGPSNCTMVEMTAADGTKFYKVASLPGSGTKNDPYVISNEKEWNTFAYYVFAGSNINESNTFAGKFVKLAKDISVTKGVGYIEVNDTQNRYPFSGTFDGDGHTVTVSIGSNTLDHALFNVIDGATIKNLTVAGSINTNHHHAAAVVGYSYGTGNKIENCVVSATVHGGSHIGGILGYGSNSDVTIENCVFKGLLESYMSTYTMGALLGWGDNGGTKVAKNCLYLMQEGQGMTGLDLANMDAGSVTMTDCYKTADAGTYGTLAYMTIPPNALSYEEITAVNNIKLYVVNKKVLMSGSGTEADPFIVSDADKWDELVDLVNEGYSLEGKFLKLGADIDVTKKLGDYVQGKPFSGTFDGGGHTVTVRITDMENPGVSLFHYIKGATIKNLTVAGNLTGKSFTSGLVGYSDGIGNRIEKCIVTATINGNSYSSGFLANALTSDVVIDNCIFRGKFEGYASVGVFITKADGGKKTVSNCLYIYQPLELLDDRDWIDLVWEVSATVTDCYKTSGDGDHGQLAFLSPPAGFTVIEKTAFDGTKFYPVIEPFSGTGSESDPYIISSERDWNAFATLVNAGNRYNSKFFKLAADISVSKKVGVINVDLMERPFSGSFDGDGHTVTVSITDVDNYGTALFSFIEGATIKNLTVAGSITGGYIASGLVGVSNKSTNYYGIKRKNKIENCIVTANVGGINYIGGILGNGVNSAITINNCVFKGTLVTQTDDAYKSAFIGWENGSGEKLVSNSLYILQENQKTGNLDLALSKVSENIKMVGSYKTTDVGTYGMRAYLTVPTVATGEFAIEKTASDGTKFYVIKKMLPGDGTSGNPYIISDASDMETFAGLVNGGTSFADKFIKLEADISIDTKIGDCALRKPFSGTFDGDDHTISTISNGNFGTALFSCIDDGAIVKNLTLSGYGNYNYGNDGVIYVNMPESGTKNIAIPSGVTSFKVYDDGGKDGNYSNSANRRYLVMTAPEGYILRVTGSMVTFNSYDCLYILDGGVGGKDLNSSALFGTRGDIDYHSTGNTMTLEFYSNASDNAEGLDLTVTVVKDAEYNVTCLDSDVGGIASCDKSKAKIEEEVLLTVTPSTEYLFYGYKVVGDGYEKTVNFDGWYSETKTVATNPIEMPPMDVSITPLFIAKEGLYVNMPESGTKNVTIPSGVTSFKVYDDGGKDSNYGGHLGGSGRLLVMTAPEGYILRVTGSVVTYNSYDYLLIRDGKINGTLLNSSKIYGIRDDIDYHSTGNAMTLYFLSNGWDTAEGLDLTVTVVKDIEYKVTCLAADIGGMVSCDKTKAKIDEEVLLTVSPLTGYLFYGYKVVGDGYEKTIFDGWYSETKTVAINPIERPLMDISITPLFIKAHTAEEGLYVNMPESGTKNVTIPSGVTSFKVYDNGGKDGNYSNYSDAYLVMTAPEGYLLRVTGSVVTYNSNDYLRIRDGGTNGTLLNNTDIYGARDDIDYHCTGNTMTLYFHSNGSNNKEGFDLTVTVIKDIEYKVTCLASDIGGTASCNKTKAKIDEEVLLTVTPPAEYFFYGYKVVGDGFEKMVFNGWYSETKMVAINPIERPLMDVSITPLFTKAHTAEDGLYVNMHESGTKNVSIPSGVTSLKVYDDGGKDGKYSNYSDAYLVMTAPEGYILRVTGSVVTYNSNDYLLIRDGKINGTLLNSSKIYGTRDDIDYHSTGNTMTLYFYSDDSDNKDGLDLTVTVIKDIDYNVTCLASDIGGTASCDKTKAKIDEEVLLTVTPPMGYLFYGYKVSGVGYERTVNLDGLFSETKMVAINPIDVPPMDVSVTPLFIKVYTAEEGLYVNMPESGTKNFTIPSGVTSFKVYDDGGKDGNYSNNSSSGYLVMTAPEGYILRVTGSVVTYDSYDYLHIHNGGTNGTLLNSSKIYGTRNDIDYHSTDNAMTLYFHSDGSNNKDGLDLTVTVVNKNIEYSITCFEADVGGSASCDKSKAKIDEEVLLTVTPPTGYLFYGYKVVGDGYEKTIFDGWYSETKTVSINPIERPLMDISITPLFIAKEGLYVNMPESGSKNVTIPSGVTSFKVYDDGGKDGNYSNNSGGYLVMTAPEGYLFRVTGRMVTYNLYDDLRIYDGGTNGTSLVDYPYYIYGTRDDIDYHSTGNTMTLQFNSDGSINKEGLDLTVTVVNNAEYKVTCLASNIGGTASCDKSKAKIDEEVLLTVTPSAGYFFYGYKVIGDEFEKTVFNGWYSETKTVAIERPLMDVAVTPLFTKARTAEEGLYVNMPESGTTNVSIPSSVTSFKVYDDGGKDGNYSNNSKKRYLIMTAPRGYLLRVTGSVVTYNSSDKLQIYDGGTSGKLLVKYPYYIDGTRDDIDYHSTGNTMTLYFYSNDSNNAEGLDLTVTVVNKNIEYSITCFEADVGGTASCNKSKAKVGDAITMTVTPPAGYFFYGYKVIGDGYEKTVFDGWYSEIKAVSIERPPMDISVTPLFIKAHTAEEGLYVNMPESEAKKVTIPSNVASFKVYDDGGKDGNYSNSATWRYIVMTAPEGYLLRVTGNVATYNSNDYLQIRDGGTNGTMLNDIYGTRYDIDYHSTGNTMTLSFYSDASNNAKGLDLTVTVVKDDEYNVTCLASDIGGTVSCDKPKARVGDAVTLTATPPTGYFFYGYKVVGDGYEKAVNFDGWYSETKTVSIKMPLMDISIAPLFARSAEDGLCVNMLESGTKNVIIPSGVTSFKVYDDGGKDGNYSNRAAWRRLVMTAPEGYILRVTGSAATYNSNDYLRIRDGGTNGTLLNSSDIYGTRDDVDYHSIGRTMALNFYSDASDNAEGLDLTVTVVKADKPGIITITEADGKKQASIDGEYEGTDVVNITEDIKVESVIFNRVFTPNSGYATIMLPFDVKATSLTGVRSVIEFDGVKTDKNNNKTVGMRYVWCNATLGEQEELNKHPNCNGYSGELKAYTPYMIEMESATLGIKDAVTLKSNSGKIVGDAPVGNWVFRGTLQKKVWPKGTGIINEGRLWAFAAAERSGAKIGEFVQFGGNNWANPFRAYLVECKDTGNGLDCSDEDSETQPKPSLVSRYRFADALAPTDSAEKSAGAAATDQPLVMRQAAASETASLNSMDIVIVYGDKDSEGDKERPTVIGRFNPATGEIRMLPRTKQTYDLKGRRVGNGKKAKGAYYRR